MIYSAGCEYAIRAVMKLAAMVPPGQFMLLRDLVESEGMPAHFVGKVLQTLARAEVLVSAKGRGGGFALARPPAEITLRQIVEAIDGPARIGRCILGFAQCDDAQPCPQHDDWVEIRRHIYDLLDNTTVADLLKAMARKQRSGARATARPG
ncbi:MAG: Rrf2 family transcriptional regulator [Planctomycetota bacterium]|nr:MAG: Rrf2 family transcriptional regulator [Planctomycetota bacterium]